MLRVERNDDQTFGHDGKIHRDPVNAVGSKKGAAIAFA